MPQAKPATAVVGEGWNFPGAGRRMQLRLHWSGAARFWAVRRKAYHSGFICLGERGCPQTSLVAEPSQADTRETLAQLSLATPAADLS